MWLVITVTVKSSRSFGLFLLPFVFMYCLGTGFDLHNPSRPTTHYVALGWLGTLFSYLSLLGAGLKVVLPHQAQPVTLVLLYHWMVSRPLF